MLSYIPYSEELFLMLFPNSNECLKFMKFVQPQKMVNILEINETELSSWLREDSTIFKELRTVKNKLGEPEFQKKVSEAYLCMIKGTTWPILDEPQENACNKNGEISNDLEVVDIKEVIHENVISKIDEDTTNTCEEIEDNDAVERNILRNIPFDVDVLISLYPKYKKLFNLFIDTNIKTISEFLNLSDVSLFSSRGKYRRLYEYKYEKIKKILSVNENQQRLLIAFNERGIEKIEDGEELQQNDVVEENNILSRIPFDAELLEILMSREYLSSINILRTKKIANMASFVKIRSEQISRWNGVGRGVIRKIQQMQNYCIENQSKIEEVYDLYKVEHTFPKKLSLEQEEFSLEGKIHIAIEQYIEFLSKKSQYLGSLVNDLERIKLLYIDRKSIIDIAGELNLTYERVRQLKSKYLNAMFEGTLKGAKNFKFSDSLKNEIEYFKGRLPLICSNITLCEMLQCDNYDESYSSLILCMRKVTPAGGEGCLDQEYFISNENNITWARNYIKQVCGVMGRSSENYDLRPMTIDNIMDLLEKIQNNDIEFDRETVLDVLEQHTWVEKLNINDIDLYQLRYKNLNSDYKQLGRLIFERKEININDIDVAHKEKLNNPSANSIINSISPAKINLEWVVQGGQNGVLRYSESGEKMQNLRTVVREWVRCKELFTLDDIIQELKSNGYTNLKELTIRNYLFESGCCVELRNQNLFCNMDYVEKYSEGHSWRNKSQHGVINWLVCTVYNYLKDAENHNLPIKTIKNKVNKDIRKTEEKYVLRSNILAYLLKYAEGDRPLFAYENKTLSLTKFGLEKPSKEWELVGLRNKRPDYYGVIVSNIVSILRESNTGEMLMSEVKKLCIEDVEVPAKNSFYKIVDNFLPKQISKLYKEGRVYLKLEQDKVEYVKSMVVKTVEKDNEIVEEVVLSQNERPIYKVGTRFEIDWSILRTDFIKECSLYSMYWLNDISFEDSVDKFIRFMHKLGDNNRLSVNIPRHLTHFWHYQNDIYAYESYLNDILLCYERLLREIYRENNNCTLNATMGLLSTAIAFPEFKKWLDNDNSKYRTFFSHLHTDRNKQSHGEELNKNLTGIILSVTQYIALYIYTVAKFWKEK